MSLLDNIFNKLKTDIVGTKTSDIDAKLDLAVKDISSFRSQTSQSNYIEIIKNLISKSGSGLDFPLLGGAATGNAPDLLGQTSRLQRYKTYEAITSNISYCNRALQVLTDNILAPDDITKTSLDIKPETITSESNDAITSNVNNVRELIKKTKLEKNLDLIIKTTLHMGDYFCEISDDKKALLSRSSILAESTEIYSLMKRIKDQFEKIEINVNEDIDSDEDDSYKNKLLKENNTGTIQSLNDSIKEIKILMDYTSFEDNHLNSENKSQKTDPSRIKLLFYEPRRVVKLQSSLFPICFGYLIFPQAVFSPHLMVQDQIVNSICQNIIKSLEKKIPSIELGEIDQSDLKNLLRTMVLESDPSKFLNIRYIPPDRMQHFRVPSTKFYPYGESIFETSQFTAKVLIALETALTIHRLNRSIQKRKILVEIGLPRDAKQATEKLKEEFKKRKFTLDSLGTIDTIPSQIGSFEDIYLPQKDGKTFVDVQSFDDAGSDTARGKTEELKFIRDSIVANMLVPPSYIGLEENSTNRNMLGEESALFARTIITHQKYITEQVQELIYKIFKISDPEKADTILDDILIALPAPRSLQYERESKYTQDLVALIQALETIGIPREYSKRKYLSNIDWNEIAKYEIEDKTEKALSTVPAEDQNSIGTGLMPGMGGLGGGMI